MNIRLATGTPPPTPAELERFRNTFLAPGQRAAAPRFSGLLSSDDLLLTIGRVLDSRDGDDCTYGRWSYKASAEKFSAWYAPCGNRSCPRCVWPYLEERVAPAWAFWDGSANRSEHRGGDVHRYWRRKNGFILQGPNTTIGGLVVPREETVVVFWPGDELRGHELDDTLLRAVRAVPIPLKVPGDPKPWMGTIPRWMSRQEFVELVRAAGGEGFRLHGRGVASALLSQAQKDELMDAIWDRGGSGRKTAPQYNHAGVLH